MPEEQPAVATLFRGRLGDEDLPGPLVDRAGEVPLRVRAGRLDRRLLPSGIHIRPIFVSVRTSTSSCQAAVSKAGSPSDNARKPAGGARLT